WDMDLSPGARNSPLMGPLRRAAMGRATPPWLPVVEEVCVGFAMKVDISVDGERESRGNAGHVLNACRSLADRS
ncbi:MAG: hypothetical protein KDJ29_07955, partial [Hyphomicrobiales bacterium]|nr:hypothetical protein [Hyphomicrobiales bacterium]